jgi:hypothetical protein
MSGRRSGSDRGFHLVAGLAFGALPHALVEDFLAESDGLGRDLDQLVVLDVLDSGFEAEAAREDANSSKHKTLWIQAYSQLCDFDVKKLRRRDRAFKVKFLGEASCMLMASLMAC